MGDRANVYVKTGDSGVYLYTHWAGTELPRTLQEALQKHWRWDDDSYLARIIFCQMVQGLEEEETGYGISTYTPDGDDRVLEVGNDVVQVRGQVRSWSFEEYCNLSDDEINDIWQ